MSDPKRDSGAAQPVRGGLLYWVRFPVLASLMRIRLFCCGLVCLLGVQQFLSLYGLSLIECYVLKLTGIPCPGCGLTRGVMAAARQDWSGVLYFNAFGPLALIAVVLMVLGCVLPTRLRDRLADGVEAVERATGVTNLCFLILWVYWLSRILILGRDLGVRLSSPIV
ncbi:MAG: DUF2752 domain-containing protein [Phycisphaeraceae bacterium]